MHQPDTSPQPRHSRANQLALGAALTTALGAAGAIAAMSGQPPVEHLHILDQPAFRDVPHKLPAPKNTLSPDRQTLTRDELKPFVARTPATKASAVAAKKPVTKKHSKPHAEFTVTDWSQGSANLQIPETQLPPAATLENLHPETLSVPAEVSAYMHDNVTYNYATRCSGFLIRDNTGIAIGEQTAQHCSLLPQQGHLATGSDGQPEARFGERFVVATGDQLTPNSMTYVGHVSKLLMNAQSDNTRDIVYGAFDGIDPETVAANANLATTEQIAALKKGDIVYASGWPVAQPNAKDGLLKRQEFAMHVLGDVDWSLTTGQQIKMKLLALPKNSNETECSYGISGGEAFTYLPGNHTLNLGTMTGFNDFGKVYNKDNPAAAQAERERIQNQFGVDMEDYEAVCAIAYQAPDRAQGAYVANVIDPSAPETEMPGTPIPEYPQYSPDVLADLDLAKQEFADPEYHKQILDGIVNIYYPKDGVDLFIHRPVVFYNPADNTVVVGYSNSKNDGELITVFYGDPSLLALYADRMDTTLPVQESVGAATFTPDIEGHDYGSYTDGTGYEFGEQLTEPPLKLGRRYDLLIDKGGVLYTKPAAVEPGTGGPKG